MLVSNFSSRTPWLSKSTTMSTSGAGVKVSSSDKFSVCLKAVLVALDVKDEEKLMSTLQRTGGEWSIKVDRERAEFIIKVRKETAIGDTSAGINLYKAISEDVYVSSYKICYRKKEKKDVVMMHTNNHQQYSAAKTEEQTTLSQQKPYLSLSPFEIPTRLTVHGCMFVCLEGEVVYCTEDIGKLTGILSNIGGAWSIIREWDGGEKDRARIVVAKLTNATDTQIGRKLYEDISREVTVVWHRLCYRN